MRSMNMIDDNDFIIAKTRLTLAKAEKEELQVQELKGELLRRERVNKVWNEKASIVKNKMLAIPEIAPALLEKTSVAAIRKALKEKVYEILEEIASEISEEW